MWGARTYPPARTASTATAPGNRDLFARSVAVGAQRGIEVLPDQAPHRRLLYFGDAYHFARLGVPAVTFFSELHADYHQPGDEADKMRYPELARIVDVIEGVVAHYAGDVPRPRFERPAWFLTPPDGLPAFSGTKGGPASPPGSAP